MLRSGHSQVREIVQEVLLSELASRLVGEGTTALQIRARLDELCPAESYEERLRLCRLLPRSGVNASAVAACLAQLEEERPVACHVCGNAVARHQLETHLRRAH